MISAIIDAHPGRPAQPVAPKKEVAVETKIIFNGKTYAKAEEMPDDIRQAYREALAQFADADNNGIPDILEGRGPANVIAIQQTSLSVNGREYKSVSEMPPLLRGVVNFALRQLDADRNAIPDSLESAASTASSPSPDANAPARGAAAVAPAGPGAAAAGALESFLRVLLSIVALATLGGALFLMVKLDPASRSQGGRFYVAIGALVILAGIDSQFRRLLERRRQSLFSTAAESRYALLSLSLLVFIAVLLFGLAWLLP